MKPLVSRLLATLALLGQVLAGALVVPDDARAAAIAAINGASTFCGAPAPHRHDHAPARPQPVCTLSLGLAPHAAPLASHPVVPLPASAIGAAWIGRPMVHGPPPLRRLHEFATPRGPPFGG